MYTKKRLVYLIALVCLLVALGVVNKKLIEKRAQYPSSEYQAYEADMKKQLLAGEENNDIENAMTEVYDVNLGIVDSEAGKLDDIGDEVNDQINDKMQNESTMKNDNYFVDFRLSRDKMRANLIERYNEIINNENTTDDVRSDAQKRILNIGDVAQKELHIEGLIKAKGYQDAILFINANNVSVVVSTDMLNEQDVAKILDIVKEETSFKPANIKIMKKQ